MAISSKKRDSANLEAWQQICHAEPVLKDIRNAIDVLPGMTPDLILTSGPPMKWEDYTGGQREAIIGGAQFEGLAENREATIAGLDAGDIRIDGCHDHGCVGSLAGIYTASMPVLLVENETIGNLGFCNMYEGTNPRRLNYGVYDQGVHDRLTYVNTRVSPVIAEAVRLSGGIPLKPIIRRALHMGDELHSRSTAAALIFTRELFPYLIEIAEKNKQAVHEAVTALTEDHYFFLRLSMAAAKATADAARHIEGSSMVTAMAFNCRGFAIRVSGLGDQWFTGPHATVEAQLFDGHTQEEITWMGGESTITETIGLGGFAQAAAFPLQRYQGGSAQAMIDRNMELYKITLGENPDYQIPALDYRGSPTGIDIFKVIDTKILPAMDIGIAGRDGGQIGAGIVRAPMECFTKAKEAYIQRYGAF
tara:strand:- start:9591 stop:10850 length:1260 start_codon:yes stop_codon:yes gene_type:complete